MQSKIKATLQEKDVQEHLAQQGVLVSTSGAEGAGAFFKTELDRHARVVKQAGATSTDRGGQALYLANKAGDDRRDW
ncbi:hypothetical protein ACTMU2_11420 [Cupriavidus basilensis]